MSNVRIERLSGPLRLARLPGESQPVTFSVHGAIAEHYGLDPAKLPESHAATLDYVVAALGGWMIGTFGGALEARKIDASNGRLRAEVRGEIESDQGVLVIRRVHVHYLLEGAGQARETVERVHRVYADKCPVYKTLQPAFEITSDFELAEATATDAARWFFSKTADYEAQFVARYDANQVETISPRKEPRRLTQHSWVYD